MIIIAVAIALPLAAWILSRLGRIKRSTPPAPEAPIETALRKKPTPYADRFGSPEGALQQALDENEVGEPTADRVHQAFAFATQRHGDQKRNGIDDLYIYHPVEVMSLLLGELEVQDADTLVAALLHDVVEDTPTPLDEIERTFGGHVAQLVGLVTKTKGAPVAPYFDRIRRAEKSARWLKIADRLSNVEDLFYIREQEGRVRAYIAETREFVLPMVREDAPNLVERFEQALRSIEDGYAQDARLQKMRTEVEPISGFQRILEMSPEERRQRERERLRMLRRKAGDTILVVGLASGYGSLAAIAAKLIWLSIGAGAIGVLLWGTAVSCYLWARRA